MCVAHFSCACWLPSQARGHAADAQHPLRQQRGGRRHWHPGPARHGAGVLPCLPACLPCSAYSANGPALSPTLVALASSGMAASSLILGKPRAAYQPFTLRPAEIGLNCRRAYRTRIHTYGLLHCNPLIYYLLASSLSNLQRAHATCTPCRRAWWRTPTPPLWPPAWRRRTPTAWRLWCSSTRCAWVSNALGMHGTRVCMSA